MKFSKPTGILSMLALSLLITLASCKKDSGGKPASGGKLLTSKTWFYYEYFTNYSESSSILVYKLEKPYNLVDLSSTRFKFNDDNTFEETSKDISTIKGTWKPVDNDETEVRDNENKLLFTIITLNDGFLVWSNKEKDTYGTMLSQ